MTNQPDRTGNPSQQTTRLLLAGGVVGPPLFILVLLGEGATRPGYNAWRHFGSLLSLSDQGWEQIANFLVCGVLSVGCAVGLRRAWRTGRGASGGPLLIGVFGLWLVVAGLFVTDPALGYPPGAVTPGPQTLHGTVHGVAGLLTFTTLTAACFVVARRFAGDPAARHWAVYSRISGALVVLGFVASTVASTMDETAAWPNAPTGLFQRLAIIAGWVWLALLARHVLRSLHSTEVQHGDTETRRIK